VLGFCSGIVAGLVTIIPGAGLVTPTSQVIHGLLGRGVAENARSDPQAKGLAEHLRARLVDVPAHLVPEPGTDLS
jgi:hypothetical protein